MMPASCRHFGQRPMPTICITNQKGGCGKTVTATNLASGLARQGKRVLLMDLDPQAPLASGLGVQPPEDILPIADAIKKKRVEDIILESPTPNLFVAPGDVSLDHQTLANEPLRDTILSRALAPVRDRFDFILLDTPPHLDLVTLNAIMASDWLILPCDADKESLLSLKRTLEVAFEYIQHRPEVDPETFYKVLITIFDDRDKTMNVWFEEQLGKLGNPPFQTKIHRATAFKKARAYGLSIFDYTQKHTGYAGGRRGVADFEGLTQEVISYEAERGNSRERRIAANAAR
jgi:chromosome partitioning protein